MGHPTVRSRLTQIFALDVRSLAVFRMALGTILLADLAVRASDFWSMYGPDGIAPVEVVRPLLGRSQWSLHLSSGAAWYQATLLAVAAALAGALVLGWRTRWATIGSWLMLVSLHARMPLVLNAGDTMLRLMLFWGIFLPLGAVWSFDARRRAARSAAVGPRQSRLTASWGTVGLVVQLALVYWLAGLGKWNERWLDGTALSDVFAFRFYGGPLGTQLLEFPTLVRWLDLATLALEIVGPCLLFVPWKQDRVRVGLVIAFVAFHLGIAATITVGLFPWVGIAAWMAIVPGWVWDRLAAGRKTGEVERSVVPPLTPPRHGESQATFERGRFKPACCTAAIVVIVYWNFVDLTKLRAPAPIHAVVQRIGAVTGLRQSWQVFARPPKFDALFVYQGRLRDGRLVDLYTGRPLAEGSHAALAPNELPNHRWRKLHLRMLPKSAGGYRKSLADYVCRQWNATHEPEEQAVRVDFYCLRRPVAATDDEAFVRTNLASIVLDEKWGNFSEALRELGPAP